MAKQTHLLGWAPKVVETPPQPVTGMKPGRALILTDKATGDTLIYAMEIEMAEQVGDELKGEEKATGHKIVLPSDKDLQAVMDTRRPQG